MADYYESKFTGAEIDSMLESVPNKTDKVQNATPGNIATLKEDGGIEDSGKKLSDFAKVTDLQKKADTTKKTTVTLSTNWTGNASPYTQTVTISGTTANSKVDLQPDATAIAQMADDGTVALYIANDNGTLSAYAVGEKPTVELTIQATITEVSA